MTTQSRLRKQQEGAANHSRATQSNLRLNGLYPQPQGDGQRAVYPPTMASQPLPAPKGNHLKVPNQLNYNPLPMSDRLIILVSLSDAPTLSFTSC